MLRFGEAPYYECSSRGDRRFSAYFARIKRFNNKSIEELYQAAKLFDEGVTGLSIKEAKGKQPINIEEVREFYSVLWDAYILENPALLEVIRSNRGFSDIFGQRGHACQAEEIYRIHQQITEGRWPQ